MARPPHPPWSITLTILGEEVLRVWRVAANILNKQSRQPTKCDPLALGLGVGLTTPHRKNLFCYEMFQSRISTEWEKKTVTSSNWEGRGRKLSWITAKAKFVEGLSKIIIRGTLQNNGFLPGFEMSNTQMLVSCATYRSANLLGDRKTNCDSSVFV
jgi:hypothetical protein